MSKILVLAEKPSVGKDIAKVLNCTKNGNGYLEGSKYIVTWAMGHLVTLADPEKYDKKYASWNLESLPIIFDKPKFSILKQTSRQYKVVSNLINRKDVTSIVIATDAGREGELVARLILLKAQSKKPIKRLWISSVTNKAINDGFNNLKNGHEYDGLFNAALARSEADWLLGINATRALTTKYSAKLSCGRVQTPTLQMIMEQDEKSKNFKSTEFYTLNAIINSSIYTLSKNNKKLSFNNIESIHDITRELKEQNIKIIDILNVQKTTQAKKLYDLTTLQREANHLYGFSAKHTLDVIQGLYEYHKVVTYPRTDSNYLTTDMKNTLNERVLASDVFDFKNLSSIDYQKLNTKSFINNTKVSDHHAIIPTEVKCRIENLNMDEFKIYKLITQRFLAVLLPAHIYDESTIVAKTKNYEFSIKGINIVNHGWKTIYDKVVEFDDVYDSLEYDIQNLNETKIGDTFKIEDLKVMTHFTKPPKSFTEGSLLAAMENPSRYVDSKKDQEILKSTGGIGTVATRADIIDKLLNSQVIERQNNNIHITNKGRQLLEIAPIKIKSPVLTAKWEADLKLIEQNKLKKEIFIREIIEFTKVTVYDIKNNFYEFKHDNLTKQKCGVCNEYMLYGKSKNGLALTCSDPSCNHKDYVYIPRRNQCPTCMKKLELIGTTFEKSAMSCNGCGYRKNVSVLFNEQSSSTPNKKQVKQLLQAQKNETTTFIDNPFGDLF